MLTENEIRNQLAVSETLRGYSIIKHPRSSFEYRNKIMNIAYIHALKYVLGNAKAKYDKEDI